jgi:hypothetical protein
MTRLGFVSDKEIASGRFDRMQNDLLRRPLPRKQSGPAAEPTRRIEWFLRCAQVYKVDVDAISP